MGELEMQLELGVAVNLLTRSTPHRIMVEGPDGVEVAKFVIQPALLQDLRVEIRPGMEAKSGGGGGSDNGAPAPMSLEAYDLLQQIEEEATQQYWIAKSATRDSSKYRHQSVEARIQYWAARAGRSREALAEAVNLTKGWVRSIEALFDPMHRMELKGTCPECDAAHLVAEVDGEMVRKPALTAGWSAGGGAVASCAACGARWAGFELHALAEHVTRQPEPAVVNPG